MLANQQQQLHEQPAAASYCPRCSLGSRNLSTDAEQLSFRNIQKLGSQQPANTKHLYTICTKSAQRLRRWSNIVQMLYKCFVFTGQWPCRGHSPSQRERFTSMGRCGKRGGEDDIDHIVIRTVPSLITNKNRRVGSTLDQRLERLVVSWANVCRSLSVHRDII